MMDKWEKIARKLIVFSQWGYSVEYFDQYLDEPDFLTEDWVKTYYGKDFYDNGLLDDLAAIDLLDQAKPEQ
jgi:hypothetical protein